MRRARCSSEVRCLSARPTRRACISGRDGLAHSFPVSNACDCWRGKGQAWHIFNILPGSSARFASCKLHSHGNWFTAPYRSRKLLKTLLLFFFYLFVSCCYFFLSEYTDIYFFVLMHCEAKERFSWPMRSGTCAVAGIVYGQLLYDRAKPHIWNICRMHTKNFTVISEEKGIRSMKRINQLDSSFVSEKCLWLKGGMLGSVRWPIPKRDWNKF